MRRKRNKARGLPSRELSPLDLPRGSRHASLEPLVPPHPHRQWLPGDPRGWRVRDHAYHVPGNYKNPRPPSTFQKNLHAHATSLLKNNPIVFTQPQRTLIGERILESLRIQHVMVRCIAVGATHIHAMVKCLDDRPKVAAGKCKQNVTRNVSCHERSGWWAADSHAKPIVDEIHFRAPIGYILDHRSEGPGCGRRVMGVDSFQGSRRR